MPPRVKPGQRVRFPTAPEWNRWEDAASFVKRYQATSQGGDVPPLKTLPPGVVRVQNDTATDVTAGCALVLNALTIGPANITGAPPYSFNEHLVFAGTEPDDTSAGAYGQWAICLEAIPAGETGKGLVAGVTWAKITKDSSHHKFVDVDATSNGYKLASNYYGAGEILYDVTISSVDWALIRIGQWQSPPYYGKLGASLSPGGSATCDVYQAGSDTSDNVTVYWDHMDAGSPSALASGTEVTMWFDRTSIKWRLLNAQC